MVGNDGKEWKKYKNFAQELVDGSNERVIERFSIDRDVWNKYQSSVGRIEPWKTVLNDVCCTIPWILHAVAFSPCFFFGSYCVQCIIDPIDKRYCNNYCQILDPFVPKEVPEWHEEALIFTDLGVRGHNFSGNKVSLTWDNISLENSEITTAQFNLFPHCGNGGFNTGNDEFGRSFFSGLACCGVPDYCISIFECCSFVCFAPGT